MPPLVWFLNGSEIFSRKATSSCSRLAGMRRKKEYLSLWLNTEKQEVSWGCPISSSETVESISDQQKTEFQPPAVRNRRSKCPPSIPDSRSGHVASFHNSICGTKVCLTWAKSNKIKTPFGRQVTLGCKAQSGIFICYQLFRGHSCTGASWRATLVLFYKS